MRVNLSVGAHFKCSRWPQPAMQFLSWNSIFRSQFPQKFILDLFRLVRGPASIGPNLASRDIFIPIGIAILFLGVA